MPNLELNQILMLSDLFPDPKSGESITFDFSKAKKFDPLPMLMTGSMIRRYRGKYPLTSFHITGLDGTGKCYAGTMGYFKYISEKIDYGKAPGEARGSTSYIPITSISLSGLQDDAIKNGSSLAIGDLIEKKASQLASVIDRGNTELHKLLTYLIREMLRNTPEHAHVFEMWICGQYWPSYKLAEIAIIDEGIGIFRSLSSNHAHSAYIKTNLDALTWSLKAGISDAFQPGHSQGTYFPDVWSNSGFVLYMVQNICRKLNGSFCLISGEDAILIDNHGVNQKKAKFDGTAIRIRVPINRIVNAQIIINEIAGQGEEEAATILNAFNKASIPSKGLIVH